MVYLTVPFVNSTLFFTKALSHVMQKLHYIVSSQEKEICKANIMLRGKVVYVYEYEC